MGYMTIRGYKEGSCYKQGFNELDTIKDVSRPFIGQMRRLFFKKADSTRNEAKDLFTWTSPNVSSPLAVGLISFLVGSGFTFVVLCCRGGASVAGGALLAA